MVVAFGDEVVVLNGAINKDSCNAHALQLTFAIALSQEKMLPHANQQ